MKILFAFMVMLAPMSASAKIDCNTHKIYCKIVELQPRIDRNRAMLISNFIFERAKAHNIDPMISVAILHQENRFRDVHTYEVERKVEETCHETTCFKRISEHHEVIDIGIAQINVGTAVYYGFDLQRLYDHDLKYAIDAHMYILEDKIKMCKDLGDYAWSCYHSKTEKYRIRYIEMVSQYL